MVCTVAAPPESLMDFLLGNERWGQLAFILISLEQERVGAVVPRVGLNGQRGERLPSPQPAGGEEGVRNCGLCGMQGSQKWLLLAMNEMKLGPGELTMLPSPSAATRREVTPWTSSGTRPGQSVTVLQFCQKGSSHPRGAESAGFWESTCSFLGEKKKKKTQIVVLIDPFWHSGVWERGSAAWGFLQRAHVGWESCLQAGKKGWESSAGAVHPAAWDAPG